ncbi:MAG: tRNA dihydrouridine synthase DusB [Eubacteriales bacterium]|nr:tRNA dihydrouridine synthase DusB [Eubacteriales bacterium]
MENKKHGIDAGAAGALNIQLAPLAGISDAPFRLICFSMGASRCTTEMISAQGYLTAPKKSIGYKHLLAKFKGEGELYAQLFGKDPVFFARAAKNLEALGRFDGININMGCPAHKVVGSGSGSALMRDIKLAASIVAAVKKAVKLPVSVKMRLGWDSDISVPFAKMLEQEGADEIILHGRTKTMQFSGRVNLEAIGNVVQSVKVPVIANGDIFTLKDFRDTIIETHCAGVMVGRGALGNPFIFKEISSFIKGENYAAPDLRERVNLALYHAKMLAKWKGEDRAVLEMRKHFAWYIKGERGASQFRREINTLNSLQEVEKAFNLFIEGEGK